MTQEIAKLLVVVGALLAGWAVILFAVKRKRFACWKRTTGTVVELIARDGGEGPDTWEPRIEFETQKGRKVQFNNHLASNPPVAPVGGSVPVLYNAIEPAEAVVDKFSSRHLVETLMFAFGVMLLIVGACYTTWR